MKTFVVRVSDTLTIERNAVLLIDAEDQAEAEEQAHEQCCKGGIYWDEEQVDNTPYEVETDDSKEADELVELLTADRDRPGPLDEDERSRMEELRRSQSYLDLHEIGRFNERGKR
jgi:hypothetical protein